MSARPAPAARPPAAIDGRVHTNGSGRLLTADDLAERWQVPKSQVYRLAREGALPAVSIGRYRRFRLEAVEDFERAGGAEADG